MQQALYIAAKNDHRSRVAEILQLQPQLNPSQCLHTSPHSSPLHIACAKGNLAVLPLLLRHSNVNVNKRDHRGKSAFHQSCLHGQTEAVKLLLSIPGVDVNQLNDSGSSPIWEAAYYGYVDVIRWIIASGKKLDVELVVRYNYQEFSVLAIAKKRNPRGSELVRMLEGYSVDPETTVLEVRKSLKVLDSMVARVFALVVLHCDGYLTPKGIERRGTRSLNWKSRKTGHGEEEDEELAEQRALRFFSMAGRLPMELQMILCGVLFGSTRELVLARDSERAFREILNFREP